MLSRMECVSLLNYDSRMMIAPPPKVAQTSSFVFGRKWGLKPHIWAKSGPAGIARRGGPLYCTPKTCRPLLCS